MLSGREGNPLERRYDWITLNNHNLDRSVTASLSPRPGVLLLADVWCFEKGSMFVLGQGCPMGPGLLSP